MTVNVWTTNDLVTAYKKGCESHGIRPLNKVLQQLQVCSFMIYIDFTIDNWLFINAVYLQVLKIV